MKQIVAASLLLMFVPACGLKKHDNSVVQSLASSANQTLINEVHSIAENNAQKLSCDRLPQLSLKYVFEHKDKYGLSDQEIQVIKSQMSEAEIAEYVLDWIDPNAMIGKAQPRWVKIAATEEELKHLTGATKEGELDVIDGVDESKIKDYAFPIITIGPAEGLGCLSSSKFRLADTDVGADGGLMLNTVQFKDVKEPWIKGAAEMYASLTYIGKDGKGVSELIELPAVDKKNVKYDLRQVIHMWNANKYQIANISFFEHDSKYDYSALAKIFVTAAASVVSAVVNPSQTTTLAVAGIVSDVATKVIDALPKGALTDDDDFVDVINTIEKYNPGSRGGVGGNAQVEMSFYKVKLNDE